MGVASFSCGNKSQKKVDLNQSIGQGLERVEDEADQIRQDLGTNTKKETRKEAEKVKHEIEKIQK